MFLLVNLSDERERDESGLRVGMRDREVGSMGIRDEETNPNFVSSDLNQSTEKGKKDNGNSIRFVDSKRAMVLVP